MVNAHSKTHLSKKSQFIKDFLRNKYESYIEKLKEIGLSNHIRKYLSQMLINEWKYMSIKRAYHTVSRQVYPIPDSQLGFQENLLKDNRIIWANHLQNENELLRVKEFLEKLLLLT